jgi:hypothetical protein
MPPSPPPGGSNSGQTIGQVFQSKGLWAWFSSPVTNYYNGQSEKGEDYSTSFGTPVGVPVGGKIVRIVSNNNAINDIVELEDSSGAVWLYQHITAKVKVGDTLGCGGIIGTENGLPVDQYSTGPHIEVRYCPPGKWSISTDSWVEPWVNPRSIFGSLVNQPAGSVDSGSFLTGIPGVGTALGALAKGVHIAPDATVAEFMTGIDTALELRNPFNVTIDGGSDFSILGVDTGIPNPASDARAVFEGAEEIFTNIVNDMAALVIRTGFIVIGIVIIYMVIGRAMTGVVNQALEPVGGIQGATRLVGAFA